MSFLMSASKFELLVIEALYDTSSATRLILSYSTAIVLQAGPAQLMCEPCQLPPMPSHTCIKAHNPMSVVISVDSGPCHGILPSSRHPRVSPAPFPQTSPHPPDHPPPCPPHS